jgi:acetamidase/formamidase
VESPGTTGAHDQTREQVSLRAPDAYDGELTLNSTTHDIAHIDYRNLDPLVGPIYVEGAAAGDALQISVLELTLLSWGWSGLLPNLGLLSDESREPYLKVWELSDDYIEVPNGARFALHPMIGCIGVAPAQDGDFATITPTNAAGNIDVRYLTAGLHRHDPGLQMMVHYSRLRTGTRYRERAKSLARRSSALCR